MKRIQYQQFGPASSFERAEVDEPVAGEGELVLNVKAASVNPLDFKVSAGYIPMMTDDRFPKGFGCDVAGTILSVGADVKGFVAGDRVVGSIPIGHSGSFAEQALLPVNNAVKLPENITFAVAAALPMTGSTAVQALVDTANIGDGSRVLINGGAGGVGHVAIQVAKARGAKVTATAAGDGLKEIESPMVDELVDYKATDVAGLGRRFDVVFDTVSSLSREQADGLLVPGGQHIDLNPGPPKNDNLESVHTAQLTKMTSERIERVLKFVDAGQLEPLIGLTFNFGDALEALPGIEDGSTKFSGKAVMLKQ